VIVDEHLVSRNGDHQNRHAKDREIGPQEATTETIHPMSLMPNLVQVNARAPIFLAARVCAGHNDVSEVFTARTGSRRPTPW
jgi:hypothetical protein